MKYYLQLNVSQFFKIKLTNKYNPVVCALKNCNLNSREKFEPGPGLHNIAFKREI